METVRRAVDTVLDKNGIRNIVPTAATNNQLQEILSSLSRSIEIEDYKESESALYTLVEFFNRIYDAIGMDPDDEGSKQFAMDSLVELFHFMSSPSLDQRVVDVLSFELPKSVVKFASVSDRFCEIADSVIHLLISTCNPRDMLAVFCEVLDSSAEMFQEPAYFIPLFSGLSKVFISLQRRHFEHIKQALPAALSILQAVSAELVDENKNSFMNLISRAIQIAASLQEVIQKLEGKQREQIRALLGLFVLEVMALTSSALADINLNLPTMSQLSQFFSFCNLSYIGLVTGDDLEALYVILGEENDDVLRWFPLAKQGALIAVFCGIMADDVAKAADQVLDDVKDNLQNSQNKRWQTIGMMKYVLSSTCQPWKIKEHAIDFILCIMEGNISHKSNKECATCVVHVPKLYTAVQAIQMVIIYTPNAVLRKKAFSALKMVLADIPAHQRFDILKVSITNTSHSSMVAILIDRVREEMHIENRQKQVPIAVLQGDKGLSSSPFWSKDVLELVECILKPPNGGPPPLPEHSDVVISALNLYRYLLITESTGRTNYTGVLSENILQKAYKEWLLPLRTLVSGIMIQNEGDIAVEDLCTLNPLQLVLHRCIELVEDELQHTT